MVEQDVDEAEGAVVLLQALDDGAQLRVRLLLVFGEDVRVEHQLVVDAVEAAARAQLLDRREVERAVAELGLLAQVADPPRLVPEAVGQDRLHVEVAQLDRLPLDLQVRVDQDVLLLAEVQDVQVAALHLVAVPHENNLEADVAADLGQLDQALPGALRVEDSLVHRVELLDLCVRDLALARDFRRERDFQLLLALPREVGQQDGLQIFEFLRVEHERQLVVLVDLVDLVLRVVEAALVVQLDQQPLRLHLLREVVRWLVFFHASDIFAMIIALLLTFCNNIYPN